MLIRSDATGDAAVLSRLIDEAAAASEVGLILVLACDANGFTPEGVDRTLQQCGTPLIGGIFPQIIVGSERWQRGTVVVGLDCRASVLTVTGISDDDADFSPRIEATLANASHGHGTLFVFIDGLARRIGALVDALFNTFGLGINYLGGGAGSLGLRQAPCIFSNQGMLADAAAVAVTDIRAGIGVAHGWESVSRPYKVTESDRNSIVSLDWRPAFEVYREVVEPHSGRDFAATPFLDLAQAYPFGIAKLDNEMVVRDPLIEDSGRLVCVGEVPQGTYVHVLHGSPDGLVSAAGHAGRLAHASYSGDPERQSMLLIDCISRALFLREGFAAELNAVNCGTPLVGALTLGEIANNGRDYPEFYNKTSVVGLLEA